MAGFGAKVKLSVDRSTAAKAEFNEQINSLTKQIKISNKFVVLQKDMDRVRTSAQTMLNKSPIKITNIDCSQAVTKLRKDLQNVINSLSIKNGVSITGLVDPTGAGTIATQIDNIADAAARGQGEVNRFNAQMSVLKETMSSLATAYKSVLPGGKNAITDTAQLDALTQRYTALKQKIEEIRSANSIASQEQMTALQNEAVAIQNEIAQINQARIAREQSAAAAKQAEKAKQDAAKATANAEAEYRAQLDKVNALIIQTKKNLDSWSASKVGKTSGEYSRIQSYVDELEALRARLILTGKATDNFGDEFGNLKTKINSSSAAIKEAGENTKTFSDRMGGLASKFTSWLTVSQIIMQVYRALREMVSVVAEVDAAMTELRKVTDETEATYSKFLDTASVRAKAVGATISDVVNATADFARLGYDISDASILADAAVVYKNVGDGIEDITTASESIISTMKAFGVEAESAMFIVDKFNEVGNNFAISSKGVGDALLRSASALAAGNNTLDESIALITAANSTVQDADKVGTTMKTVSMFLRAAKTEAEEAGESTEGMANSVSELREEILALTGNKVDIQIDENTFKSTYQIMKELSEVWGDLTDVSQANILEMIGGKRNSNVVMSLLENFEIAEEVIASSANAAGSALAENEKYLDSIAGKVSKFKATFEELSITLIDSESVKQIVDFGTGLLNILNSIAKVVDALGGLNTALKVTVGILAIVKAESLVATITNIGSKLSRFGNDIAGVFEIFTDGFKAAKASGSSSLKAIGNGFKSVAGLASTAQIAVAAFVAVITAISLIKNAIEEARQKTIESSEAIIDETNARLQNVATLKSAYIEYNKYAELTDRSESENNSLKTAVDKVTQALGDKKLALEGLTQGTKDYNDALRDLIDTELEDAYYEAKEARIAAEDLLGAEVWSGWDGSQITIDLSGRTGIKEFVAAKDILEEAMGDFIDMGTYGEELEPIGFDADHTDMAAIVDYYYKLLDVKRMLLEQDLTENDIYDGIIDKTGLMADAVDKYVNAVYKEIAADYEWRNGVPDTVEELEAFRAYLNETIGEMFEFDNGTDTLSDLIDQWLSGSGYTDLLTEMAEAPDSEGIATYTAELSKLTDVLSKLQSAYSALEAAEKDMATGQGLTAETVAALAAAEEDYLNYIYEENGVLMLNTEAWKDNANAKMLREMVEIESEINSLAEQNRLLAEQNDTLEENIEYYKEQRDIASDGGMWNQLIIEATNSIEDNNDAIAENSDLIRENQGLLAVYGTLYGDITGDISAYNEALENFANVANVIDSVATSYAGLANLQNAVADGFTFSLDKILEYAKAYPEILNSATVTANGELALNEAVVNSFIAGKKAELDAQIDAEIAKLEADKAVLEAKKANATAQLELAKAVVNGESELTREEAIYKLNTGNALAEALINMEVDRATAYKLATAAMAENEEEFTRIAMECFQNMDENSAKAAYNMAHAIYVNAQKSAWSIADIAKQAHETAKAIRGMANGYIEGADYSLFTGGTGVYTGGYDYSAPDGNFVGTEYNYEAKQISLDEYIADLELDISDYENAIEQINGQIATLEALRNTPFESFKNLVDNASSIVGEKTNDKIEQEQKEAEKAAEEAKKAEEEKKKLVEEYIAAIDEYYMALKRLEEVQKRRVSLEKKLEHTEDLSEKIFLSSGLIDVYKEEAEAERNLMAAKQATISANVGALRGLGFQVSYDPKTNELYIKNLEHLNELTANSAGEYETLQEATNALRKETEDLIETTEQLNQDNIDAAENIEDLGYEILETKNNIIDYIEEIYDKQVESYQKIIDLRKELIESAKDEYDYEADIAEKVKEIADLQSRIDQLALDDSRSAQAERASLMQELAEKQQELADTQGDHATDSQLDALDKMAEDYEQQRADEIEIMRNTVTESEELWNAFYQTILGNTAIVGASVDEHIANAWIRAAQAVNDYSAAMSGISSGGVVINSIPKYHTGGVVDEANVGKDETLALLEKGEVVLNDGKQQTLYKIIDFQEELSKRLGTVIGSLVLPDITGSIRSMVGDAVNNITDGSQSLVFEPHIQVEINHSGTMNDTDAKSYGEKIADTAIEKLYSAFERRGISSTRASRLKP
ncbi:MAG: phage tail tape measure protein [Alistipes sp.]|nr:phage tail tape measure protein [Alistipes sp.]